MSSILHACIIGTIFTTFRATQKGNKGALLWEKIDLPLFLAPPTAARRGGAAGSLITGVIMLRAEEERGRDKVVFEATKT